MRSADRVGRRRFVRAPPLESGRPRHVCRVTVRCRRGGVEVGLDVAAPPGDLARFPGPFLRPAGWCRERRRCRQRSRHRKRGRGRIRGTRRRGRRRRRSTSWARRQNRSGTPARHFDRRRRATECTARPDEPDQDSGRAKEAQEDQRVARSSFVGRPERHGRACRDRIPGVPSRPLANCGRRSRRACRFRPRRQLGRAEGRGPRLGDRQPPVRPRFRLRPDAGRRQRRTRGRHIRGLGRRPVGRRSRRRRRGRRGSRTRGLGSSGRGRRCEARLRDDHRLSRRRRRGVGLHGRGRRRRGRGNGRYRPGRRHRRRRRHRRIRRGRRVLGKRLRAGVTDHCHARHGDADPRPHDESTKPRPRSRAHTTSLRRPRTCFRQASGRTCSPSAARSRGRRTSDRTPARAAGGGRRRPIWTKAAAGSP